MAVLREALTNAARHAHATAVDVAAEATATHLRLRVTDDGRGIDPARTRRGGLADLHTRAAELGGTLTPVPPAPPWSGPSPSPPATAEPPRKTRGRSGTVRPKPQTHAARDAGHTAGPRSALRPACATAWLSRRPEHWDNVPATPCLAHHHPHPPFPGPRATTTWSSS
ncbi:ATP-binding protein [Streptomyces sp. NBC_00201]|uniref:sensor histidine kinase n=1 Tax=Streptomyces sp. NBC_00201 TaxID=2975679 RepID=UPI00224EE9F6|nr:ATP-binding protein [Streptomyces sp. NBC_00201]MCX5247113.1 ATP-binding protein [Streptomyces sp. NBC_00201]